MINKNDVTIIIPTMNQPRNNIARKECLISLEKSGFPKENIVLAFNNCKVSGLVFEDNQVMKDGYKCVFLSEQGQCKAVNAGVASTNTPWIMISNDDMVYPLMWFELLTDGYVTSDSDLYTISPQLVEPGEGAPTFIRHFCGGVGGDWDANKFYSFTNNYNGMGIRRGFNLPFLLKREIWDTVGGYDVEYDPWSSNSDSDFEYKLKLAGIDMYQNTNCPVYHFSQTSGTFHPDNRSYWQKNWDYFISKWGFERASSPEIWTTEFEIDYEKLKYRPKWAKLP